MEIKPETLRLARLAKGEDKEIKGHPKEHELKAEQRSIANARRRSAMSPSLFKRLD